MGNDGEMMGSYHEDMMGIYIAIFFWMDETPVLLQSLAAGNQAFARYFML